MTIIAATVAMTIWSMAAPPAGFVELSADGEEKRDWTCMAESPTR